MLVYGHVDVQPADPLELWETDPFTLEQRGEWLYGRGVADDKGQLYMLTKAATELAAAGELPVNVRFTCDSEEETGGHQIVDFLAADERGADAALIFDSGMTKRGVPEFAVATRGLVYFHVTVRTGERDLHSGALRRGRAERDARPDADPGRGAAARGAPAGTAPGRGSRRRPRRRWPPGPSSFLGRRCSPRPGRGRPTRARAEEFYLRTTAEPALDVNGIMGGSPVLQKTVLPVFAEANVSIRLAPGQEVETIAGEVERLLREAAPEGAELEVTRLSAAPAGLVPPDARAVQIGLDVFEQTMGTRPLLVRSGARCRSSPRSSTRASRRSSAASRSRRATSTRRTSGSWPSTCRSGSRSRASSSAASRSSSGACETGRARPAPRARSARGAPGAGAARP